MLSFKTDREREEYGQLPAQNMGLFNLIHDLVDYVDREMHKDVVLTSIKRTAEQQEALYASSDHKVINSPHLTWDAVDLRSWVYTEAEINAIIAYLNAKYKNSNGKVVAMIHAITNGAMHFHLQLYKP